MCTIRRHAFFFFNDTATTEIYTLSLHDALPIYIMASAGSSPRSFNTASNWSAAGAYSFALTRTNARSEEHTSELQSHLNLVCRLLLEKKKNTRFASYYPTRSQMPTHLSRPRRSL